MLSHPAVSPFVSAWLLLVGVTESEVIMSTADRERVLHRMRAAAQEALARAEAAGGHTVFALDASRVGRGPGGCLYRLDPPPEVLLVEDAPVRLSSGGSTYEGRLGPVADESCLLETELDLGPRVIGGRLTVDNA